MSKPDNRPCRDCGEVKHKSLFTKNHVFADGIDTLCLDCNHRRVREWRAKGKRKSAAESKRYYDRYPEKGVQRQRLRKSRMRIATPSWMTADDIFLINEAIRFASLRSKITGILWHIDHIIPLAGKGVSGLNVPWNVRVITAQENWRKANKVSDY